MQEACWASHGQRHRGHWRGDRAARNWRQVGWTHLFSGLNAACTRCFEEPSVPKEMIERMSEVKGSIHSLGNCQKLPEG